MSALLVIFAGESREAPVTWRAVNARGDVEAAGEGALGALASLGASDVCLVLPGYLVSAISAHLPARNERQALAAAPFAVEDDIAADPDHQHFALVPLDKTQPAGQTAEQSQAQSQGQRTVLTIDRTLLSEWTSALTDLGLSVRSVLPDFLCLPVTYEHVVAVGLPDRLVLRHGNWGVAVEADIATAVAPAILDARETETASVLVAGSPHGLAGLEIDPDAPADPFAPLATAATTAGAGLLQGDFTVRQRRAEGDVSIAVFKWPALLAAAATLIVSAVSLLQGALLQSRAETIRANTETMFRQAFPETGRVVNVRAQLRQATQGTESGRPDFLVLSGYVAAGLDAVDAVSVEAMRFDDNTRELNASILFDSYDALARFRMAVEAAGGRVVEGGSRQVGNRRAGDVKVTLP